jgi:regulator of nucleoside diphosphate kinase
MTDKATVMTEHDRRRLWSLLHRQRSPRARPSAQLRRLKDVVRRARVVASNEIPRNVVTMNSIVRLRDMDTGDCWTCALAYPDDARSSTRNVSIDRPLGQALLGKNVGQIIRWQSGGSVRRLRIQNVVYQPEAAGHHRL